MFFNLINGGGKKCPISLTSYDVVRKQPNQPENWTGKRKKMSEDDENSGAADNILRFGLACPKYVLAFWLLSSDAVGVIVVVGGFAAVVTCGK